MRSAVPPEGYDPTVKINGIDIPDDKLADFCRRWKITELALRSIPNPDLQVCLAKLLHLSVR